MVKFSNNAAQFTIASLSQYIISLQLNFHTRISLLGLIVMIVFISQLFSGILLSFSLVPESMLIPVVRDLEDVEVGLMDDIFWIHERGVDYIFIFIYAHMFRKLYLLSFYFEQEFAWKSGIFLLMFTQIVTFLGLVLCCTHLSDITLKIAGNTMHTIVMFKSKIYWWLFTDKNLNTDTLLRLAYAHYVTAFALFGLALLHAFDMHYDWKTDSNYDGLKNNLQWWNEALINELALIMELFALTFLLTSWIYCEPEPVSYEIFMWGDIGLIIDPNFNQVAPHWYFRPLMSFLLVIPHALLGVFGLVLFFFLLYHQPTFFKSGELNYYVYKMYRFSVRRKFQHHHDTAKILNDFNLFYQIAFCWFLIAVMYTTTFLPNGKYYQVLGGNEGMLCAYFYILIYLTYPIAKSFYYKFLVPSEFTRITHLD